MLHDPRPVASIMEMYGNDMAMLWKSYGCKLQFSAKYNSATQLNACDTRKIDKPCFSLLCMNFQFRLKFDCATLLFVRHK